MHLSAFLRVSGTLALFIAGSLTGPIHAESPPAMPLPPCVENDGTQEGACPATNEFVGGQAAGTLTANGTIPVSVAPTIPVCTKHIGGPPYPWTPSPCYSAVHKPVVLGCGYIDLGNDNTWTEGSCSAALFRDPADAMFPMFEVAAAEGGEGCGGRGNFQTYIYGGPANVDGATWGERGPNLLDCTMTFNGPRPDGLYGPTWVKLRVGIDKAENGDNRRGFPEYAEMFVPIDGDVREDVVDVSLLASYSLRQDGDAWIVTYSISMTNAGKKAAEGVQLIASHEIPPLLSTSGETETKTTLPEQLHVIGFSDNSCAPVNRFTGGALNCSGIELAATGDSFGQDVSIIDFEARIINVADLPPVTFEVKAPGDIDDSDNTDRVTVSLPLAVNSIEQTRQAMEVLRSHFNYSTDINYLNENVDSSMFTCNNYMNDIFARFERIRLDHPEVFANLSYGPVTSGKYFTAAGTSAGHVGIVVYPKGSDYRQTGIIVHGLPSPSPLSVDPERFDTQVSVFELGEAPAPTLATWTSLTGDYYRTPVTEFPGVPRPENQGCGFEGLYADNGDEFARTKNCGQPARGSAETCPVAPDAMTFQTESPVDLRVTNLGGQRVETVGNTIAVQELDTPVYSIAFPHLDGTYGWTLVLPPDDYELELIGTGSGPYKFTMTRFSPEGEPQKTVIEGTSQPGGVEGFPLLWDTLFVDGFGPEYR